MIQDKPWWRNPPPAPQPHQIMAMSGEIYYMPGDWGEKLCVGEKFKVSVFRTKARLNPLPVKLLAETETNPNGEFMLQLIIHSFNVKIHRVSLVAVEKEKLKSATFDLSQLVNLQLTTQSQLIPPLVVPWGP